MSSSAVSGSAVSGSAASASIETDYLVIGAGAAGMAFTDSLIDANPDVDVVVVDRRHVPGGHWNDAYPFVRLHQPAACYGVSSTPLGGQRIDGSGLNAGLYEQAGSVQICDYFRRVMDDHLLASGQVRFLPMTDYLGLDSDQVAVVENLTGVTQQVGVRRAVVDARYLEPTIPSRHVPSFSVAPDVRFVTVNELVDVQEPAAGYTVIGGGKTGSDACSWLLGHGVDPERIRWMLARDAWMWNRAQVQPLELLPDTLDGYAAALEASAEADSAADLFERLESTGTLLRLDPRVEPRMYHGATITAAEVASLRSIEDVVRLGHVVSVDADEVVLERGTTPTGGHVFVDCSAAGLAKVPARPVFEESRITLQCVSTVFPTFNASVIGYIETTRSEDHEAKSRLAPTTRYPDAAQDWIPNMRGQLQALELWNAEADLAAWLESNRLNVAAGMIAMSGEPRVGDAIGRLLNYSMPAADNLARLDAAAAGTPGVT